uniref:Uncharacterized protein n=1 Tax=Glossina palpalis gambiensis TaxID=67801 RepID=A0A1B0BPW2_9MUSC
MSWTLLIIVRILIAITLINNNFPMVKSAAVMAEISTAYDNENEMNDQVPLDEKRAWNSLRNMFRGNRIPQIDENLGYAILNEKRLWKNFESSWEKPGQLNSEEKLLYSSATTNPESKLQTAYLTNAAILDQLVSELNSSEDVDDANNMLTEKRAWKALNVAWGAWGKREPNWSNLKGMWGKRSKNWQKLQGTWGKRTSRYHDQQNAYVVLTSINLLKLKFHPNRFNLYIIYIARTRTDHQGFI